LKKPVTKYLTRDLRNSYGKDRRVKILPGIRNQLTDKKTKKKTKREATGQFS